jgi:hypothetical protein
MGDGPSTVRSARRQQAERSKEMTLIHAVMVCIILLILIQFLLLMVAVEGLQGGRSAILLPAAAGSGACFLASCWLIRYVASRRA